MNASPTMLLIYQVFVTEENNTPDKWESSTDATWDNMTDTVWEEEKS